MVKYSITAHKIIAIVSFLVLSSVQFFLLYNTYELKDEHYNVEERNLINTEYSYAIRNDKLMPGGARILDRYINGNMKELEWLHAHDTLKFNVLKQEICDSAFAGLRKANNVDSLLNRIVKANNLSRNLQYALLIQSIEVTFQHNKYITLYNQNEHYPLIDPAVQTKDGIYIGGTLHDINQKKNLATALIVSSPADYTYRISFGLYVDTYNRTATILRLMMPSFALSLLSVLFVVLLFFITLQNWIRQKKLSEMKSDFINSITHEFHTPLAAIIVANKTMQNEKIISSKESIKPLTEVIQRQSERLKMLISEVLQITTMNKISLRREEYSIHHLLDEVLLDYRLKLTGTNIKLMLKKDAVRDTVLLDRFWFTTVLLNLFDNAVKYNNKELKEITVTTFNDKKGISISIRDNGPGMTTEIQRHIFEKFYRNVRHVNEQVKGLGLGLFYVKQAIEAHKWKIDIESIEGTGSEFIISIPL
jgi:two-component system, OmpR family, phosphate regulon sensor histidine kinase PhoR